MNGRPHVELHDPLLTPGEVAERLNINPKTVTRWAADGKIKSIRLPGGHRRFRESVIKAIENGEEQP